MFLLLCWLQSSVRPALPHSDFLLNRLRGCFLIRLHAQTPRLAGKGRMQAGDVQSRPSPSPRLSRPHPPSQSHPHGRRRPRGRLWPLRSVPGLPSWGLTGGDSQAFASPCCVAPGCSQDTGVGLSGEGAALPPETQGQGIPDCQDWGEAVGIWWVGPGLQPHRHATLGRAPTLPNRDDPAPNAPGLLWRNRWVSVHPRCAPSSNLLSPLLSEDQ